MRRLRPQTLCLAFTLFPALTVLAAPAGARTHKTRRCPANSHLLAADSEAELYLAPIPASGELGVYGCSYRSRRAYLLGEPSPDVGTPSGVSGIEEEVLSGSMVAFESGSGGPTGANWTVNVRNLSNGRFVHSSPTGSPPRPAEETENGLKRSYSGIGPAKQIVVKSDGSVAWIAENDQLSHNGKYYEVHALDKTGARTLATGTDIDPGSLALSGSTLYWTQGGAAESTTLN